MQDRCNQILQNGVFNTVVHMSKSAAHEQLTEWLMSVEWEDFKKKQDAGLKVTLPIDGIPVSFDGKYSEDQFRKFENTRNQGLVRNYTAENMVVDVERTVDKHLADVWRDCIERESELVGLNCWATEDGIENGTVVFHASYHPDQH